MPITLRPETLEKLRPEIVKYLNACEVTKGSILEAKSGFWTLYDAEKLLPETGPRRDAIKSYVGESSILDFMLSETRRFLDSLTYSEDETAVPLLQAIHCDDVDALADHLLNSFQSIPWRYWVTIPLPDRLAAFVRQMAPIREFSPRIRFIHDKAEIENTSPAGGMKPRSNGLFGLLGGATEPGACLQFQVDGFVARFGRTETLEEAKSHLRGFLGLGLALEVFHAGSMPTIQMPRQQIHFRRIDGDDANGASHSLTDGETATIHSISPKLPGLLFQADTPLVSEEKMEAMAAILSNPQRHKILLRACEWLFNSHVGDDPLLNFVQATVVLEITLGDKASSDEIGLGTLLANRCAYMIGRTTSERAEILKEFKAIYGVRSQIVHSGKHRLTSTETYQLHRLRWLGRSVIREEVKLATEEINREKLAAQRKIAAALAEGVNTTTAS